MEFDPISPAEFQELAQFSKETLENILEKMQFVGTVNPRIRESENTLVLDIVAEADLGLLIGKDGNTLRALQTIMRVLLMKRFGKKAQILLDADNYLLKREESLKDTAYAALQRVEETNRKVQLKPMNSVERRIVHMTLAEEPNIHTYSIGEGPDRRVVIAPGAAPTESSDSDRFNSYDAQPQPSYQDAQ